MLENDSPRLSRWPLSNKSITAPLVLVRPSRFHSDFFLSEVAGRHLVASYHPFGRRFNVRKIQYPVYRSRLRVWQDTSIIMVAVLTVPERDHLRMMQKWDARAFTVSKKKARSAGNILLPFAFSRITAWSQLSVMQHPVLEHVFCRSARNNCSTLKKLRVGREAWATTLWDYVPAF